jgi:hypothetical protein
MTALDILKRATNREAKAMKSNKHIVHFTALAVISGTMLPLWWTFGDWDCMERHEEAAMKNQTLKAVVSAATMPQSIPPALKPTQSIPEKPCWRRCHQRVNEIVCADNPNVGAGITDRCHVLTHMAKLAGCLCTTVDFPKPHSLLGTMHDHNQPMTVNSTWNDCFNLTFYQDDSPAVCDLPDDILHHPTNSNAIDDVHAKGKNTKTSCALSRVAKTRQFGTFKQWKHFPDCRFPTRQLALFGSSSHVFGLLFLSCEL